VKLCHVNHSGPVFLRHMYMQWLMATSQPGLLQRFTTSALTSWQSMH